MTLPERVLAGERLAIARLMTLIENEAPEGLDALGALYQHTGRAHLLGITGAPGTGKSTLVNGLVKHFRSTQPQWTDAIPKVGIIAVDPSSPFSGGAILGDRIRMRDLAGDDGVFIRSMASRGALGGVARATSNLADVLDAAGYDIVIIETVGAGQAEVDIASAAHTTVVIDSPGLGDVIQANKAGILEIADILVVNKADLQGAENTIRTLEISLSMANSSQIRAEGIEDSTWVIPVIATVATKSEGIEELAEGIVAHRAYLTESGVMETRERGRIKNEMIELMQESLMRRYRDSHTEAEFETQLEAVLAKERSPRQAVAIMLEALSP